MIIKHKSSISHLRRAAGKDSPLVYRSRQGVTDGYERPDPVNPNTSDQQLSRQAWSRSCAAWKELSAEQKAGWNSYGATHAHHFPERRSAEPLTGYRLFHAAAGNRQILGLSTPTSAPGQLRPEVPTRVELLPSAEAGTLRLLIKHKLKGDAFRVVVSMSAATVRVSRKPDRRAGRHVRGWGQASTAPLPESGGEIVFSNCRYAVESGRRFGVWLRIVRESDGLASPELFLDFTRPEPEPLSEPATQGGDGLTGSVGNTLSRKKEEAAAPVPPSETAPTGASFLRAGEGAKDETSAGSVPPGISRDNAPAPLREILPLGRHSRNTSASPSSSAATGGPSTVMLKPPEGEAVATRLVSVLPTGKLQHFERGALNFLRGEINIPPGNIQGP